MILTIEVTLKGSLHSAFGYFNIIVPKNSSEPSLFWSDAGAG